MSTEKLNYGVSCKNVDWKTLNARNQLIKQVVNPLLDMILEVVKKDRAEAAPIDQRFNVNVVVTSERPVAESDPITETVRQKVNGAHLD